MLKTYLWKLQVPEKRKAERSTRISRESLQEVAFLNILETVINAAQYSGGKRARVQGVSPLQVQKNKQNLSPSHAMAFWVVSLFGEIIPLIGAIWASFQGR